MNYYLITYQATNNQGSTSIWNQVIDCSPMSFIKMVQQVEEDGRGTYHNFVITNTCKISVDEFMEYDGHF